MGLVTFVFIWVKFVFISFWSWCWAVYRVPYMGLCLVGGVMSCPAWPCWVCLTKTPVTLWLWAVPLPPVYRGSCLVWQRWLDGRWLAGHLKGVPDVSSGSRLFSVLLCWHRAARPLFLSSLFCYFTTTHTLCWSALHWALLSLAAHLLIFRKYFHLIR